MHSTHAEHSMQPQPPEIDIHVQAASLDSHSAKTEKLGRLLEEIMNRRLRLIIPSETCVPM